MECKKANNLANCNCTNEPCVRKGICCECIAHHRKKNELPACYFPFEAERTFDRTINHFLKINLL